MDIVRTAWPDTVALHGRLPAWEAGDHRSLSAGSSIGVSFTGQRCVVTCGAGTRDIDVPPHSVVMQGSQPAEWLRVDGPSEIVEISATRALRSAIAQELGEEAHRDLADRRLPAHPGIWVIAARLRSALRGGWPIDRLEADWLVRLAYGHAFHLFGARTRERHAGALDPRRLGRVQDYLEARLAEPLTLDVLAAVAALSPFHFQRSFRAATGLTPHRYVAIRRAQRALDAAGHALTAPDAFGYRDARHLRHAVLAATGRTLPQVPAS